MGVFLKFKRQKSRDSESYMQTFLYEGSMQFSVLGAIHSLGLRPVLTDVDGEPADRVAYESSCIQKRCGACAILINGKPRLACEVFLEDIVEDGGTVDIAPLSKFPVICDLVVDRGRIYENMKKMKLWLSDKAGSDVSEEERALQYKSAQCLQCGCCLEVCPVFKGNDAFYGTPGLVTAYKLLSQSEDPAHKEEMIQKYEKHFLATCDESYDCEKVCPAGIPIEEMFVRLNAVVKKS